MRRPSGTLDALGKVPRLHAADHVFEQLAVAIMTGQFPQGSTLPPEQELADRFGASRIIIRQAVHRLAEADLVRSRQGGATLVLDPEASADPRVIELLYRLGPTSARDVLDFTERQLLHGHALLSVAERRATAEDRQAISALVEQHAAAPDLTSTTRFELAFFTALAEAGGNRIYRIETRFWFRLLATQPKAQHPEMVPLPMRIAIFRELARRLVAHEPVAQFYLDMLVKPALLMLEAAAKSGKST